MYTIVVVLRVYREQGMLPRKGRTSKIVGVHEGKTNKLGREDRCMLHTRTQRHIKSRNVSASDLDIMLESIHFQLLSE